MIHLCDPTVDFNLTRSTWQNAVESPDFELDNFNYVDLDDFPMLIVLFYLIGQTK